MSEESDNEEQILLSREYQRHLEEIKKVEIREEHFYYKNVGYSECLETYQNDLENFSVLFGYILEKEIPCDEFIEKLSKKMSEEKIDICCLTESIINKKLETMEEIEKILQES